MRFVTHYSLLIWLLASPTFGKTADLKQKITDAARRASLDPRLVEAVVKVESNYKANATSSKGAKGLMQVMESTEAECDIHNAYQPLSNLMGACECLRKLVNRYQGKLDLALAAYNAGPKAVDKYRGIPPYPETLDYVEKVLSIYRRLKG